MSGSIVPGGRLLRACARGGRLCLVLASTFLILDGLAAAPASAGPVTRPALPPQAAAQQQSAESEAESAAWQAHKYGKPIEIVSQRTESSQTFVQPDGTYRLKQSAVPVRVRRGSGWVPVNPTLQPTADGWVPVATTLDLRFSPGGPGPLLSFGRDGKRISVAWSLPRPLRPPVVFGATATYEDVLDGVDLRLTASTDSFSEVLVVKTPEAAKSSELRQLQFGLTGQGVTLRQNADDGVIQAVDGQGTPVFISDGAAMWDSPAAGKPSTAKEKAAPQDTAAAEPGALVKIPVTLSAETMTVTPSQAMLTSRDANFPLYIDPGFNGGKEIWTVVSRLHPDTSYWTNDSYRDTMRVGQSWQSGSTDDWRTIVQFNVNLLNGTQILSASVLTKVAHTADCTPSSLGLFRTRWVDKTKSVTWNNTKSTDATKKWWSLRTVKATANKSRCPKGDDEVEFGDPSGTSKIRAAFQEAATKNYDTITFGFRAPDEGDDYQWKKLTKDSTYLDINYNRKPGTPTALTVTPCDKNPCSSPAKSNSEKPKLKMTVADPDGGSLTHRFEVWDNTLKTLKADSGTAVTGVKSGSSSAPWAIVGKDKKPLPDGVYQWRGYACDGSKFCGPYSAWYKLTIDTTNPGAPKVDIIPYRRWTGGEDNDVPGGYGSPGTAGTMTVTPSATTDVVSYYHWWFTGDTAVHKLVPNTAGAATTPVEPTREGIHTIKAYAVDAAGNRTVGEAEYVFKVAPAGGQWVWHMDNNQPGLTPSEPENSRPLKNTGTGQSWTDRNDGSALALNGSGATATDLPVLNTTAASGFTVAAWVRIDEDPTTAPPPDDNPSPDPDPTDEPGEEDPAEPDAPAGEMPPSVLDHTMTAVSQDGLTTSMFRLGYRADVDLDGNGSPDRAWCFALTAADAADAAETRTCSPAYLQQGDWVHLVGVADRIHNEVRLYINGGPGLQFGETAEETGVMVKTTGSAAWAASEAFAVGRGKTSTGTDYWSGQLDDVYAVPRVWSDTEIETKAARENW